MTAPNPLAVPEPWNLVADAYAAELEPVFSLYARDALALAAPSADAHVLDVATGPGTLALIAATRVAHVAAIDFAAAMVERFRRQCTARNIANVAVSVGDGQALPFADASFECAFSMFGLIFFPDRAAGFRELRRVLVSGGRAVVSAWAPMEQVTPLAAIYTALRELAPPPEPSPSGSAPSLPLGDAEQFRAEMSAAGFRDVEIHTVAHELTLPSVEELWASNERSSARIALQKHRTVPTEWSRISAGVVDRLRAQFGADPLTLRWPALLGLGVR